MRTSISAGAMWVALSTSSARVLCPAGLVVAVVLSFEGGWTGSGWNDALRAGVNHSWFLALMVSAAAALDAQRYRRKLPTVGSSVRGLSPVITPLLAVAGWGIACLLVLMASALAAAAAVSAWRTPELLLVVVGCAWLVGLAGIGWFIGWWLPHVFSIPMTLVMTWLGSASLAASTDRWPAVFSGIDDGVFTANIHPVRAVLVMQIVVFTLAGLICCSLVRVHEFRPLPILLAAVGAGVVLVQVLTTVAANGPARRVEVMNAAGPRICSPAAADRVAVCVWPDDVAAQRIAATQAAVMWGSLRAAGKSLPVGVTDAGLDSPDEWVAITLWDPDPADIAVNLSRATLAWLWCGNDDKRIEGAEDQLFIRQLWLQNQVLPIEGGFNPELRTILRLDPAAQARWVTNRPAGVQCGNR